MTALILHGWQGSGPDHWQTWLAGRLGDDARYPALPDADDPDPDAWDAALREHLPGCEVVVCHSLACIAWLRHAAETRERQAERVLLVAPPSPDTDIPEVARFFPVALDPAPVAAAATETRLVCADDDPYCPEGAAGAFGAPLRIPVDLIPGGGHLNPDAGLGPWPAVEAWVRRSADRVTR